MRQMYDKVKFASYGIIQSIILVCRIMDANKSLHHLGQSIFGLTNEGIISHVGYQGNFSLLLSQGNFSLT